MKSNGKYNVPSLASQNVQARNKQTNCRNTQTNKLYRHRKTKPGTQPRQRSKLRCTSARHCFDQFSSAYLQSRKKVLHRVRKCIQWHLRLPALESCINSINFFILSCPRYVRSHGRRRLGGRWMRLCRCWMLRTLFFRDGWCNWLVICNEFQP